MISSIDGNALQVAAPSPQSLSEDQENGLQDILSNYDPENLSHKEAAELVAGIQDLGIRPGQALREALARSGIEARDLADQAGISSGGGPERPGRGGGSDNSAHGPGAGQARGGINPAAVEVLESVLEALESKELTTAEEFQEFLLEQLIKAGLDTAQPIVDIKL